MGENKIRQKVYEAVKKILRENLSKRGTDEWYFIKETLGETEMLNALFNYLSSDVIEDFCDFTKRMYELNGE